MNNLSEPGRCVPPSRSYNEHPHIPIGTQIGRWVVIENDLRKHYPRRSQRACRVRCKCGNEGIVTYAILRQGKSKSCGCKSKETERERVTKHPYFLKFPPIPIGKVFGQWTVIENDVRERVNIARRSRRACRVRCECGNEGVVSYANLRKGVSASCGHKAKERDIESAWNKLLSGIKNRGWDFHLTLPQLKAIVKLPCAYCGREPSNLFRMNYKVDGIRKRDAYPEMDIRWSGLDRVDSSKGYVFANVVPCCAQCNAMKSKLGVEEFFELIGRIHAHNSTVLGIREIAANLLES